MSLNASLYHVQKRTKTSKLRLKSASSGDGFSTHTFTAAVTDVSSVNRIVLVTHNLMAQIIFYTCQLSRARTAPPAFAAVFMKSWACFTDWNHRSYRPLTFLSSALRLTSNCSTKNLRQRGTWPQQGGIFVEYTMNAFRLAVSGTFTKRTSGHCLERRTVLYSLTILSSVSKSPLH
ncbi:hypothetical protein Tsp_09214 [Trichinella spiralis]|uniref:hypothetical protein n=1 Tax=Trichinella spiralis TaxID=6334 RepID=UPI0001EFC139|nr:hypothetical protein Tsp_09214 [Trichinella spiralis]